MIILNSQNYFTNDQLKKILGKLGDEYDIDLLIIVENRKELFKYDGIKMTPMCLIQTLFSQVEGAYLPLTKTIMLFVFAQNEYKDFQSSQLYSIHALLHELRHAYQWNKELKISEEDSDNFATRYLNKHSKFFTKIMGWEDEWEVEEED